MLQPRPLCPALYAISVRRLGTLPAASFRFHLTMDTLAVRLTLPTTKRVVDFHHQAIAHGGRTDRVGGNEFPLPHHRSCGSASGGSVVGTRQHVLLDTRTLGDSAIPSVTHLSSGGHPLSSNCFQHAPIPVMLYYQQPPGPFLRQFSLTSLVLWPRLTSVGSITPCGVGYNLRCVPHRPPRIRCNSLRSM